MELALVVLAVSDLPRALAFYRGALGWDQVVDAPVYVELLSPNGVRLGLYDRGGFAVNTAAGPPAPPVSRTTGTELYLLTSDPAAGVEAFLAQGAELLSPLAARTWGDEAAYLADPDGNVVVVAGPA